MDSIINRVSDAARDVISACSDFSPATWSVIAIGAVIFGYVMLKGMHLGR